MAITWTEFENGESLLSVRNKLNAFNNSVVILSDTNSATLVTLQSGISTNTSGVATNASNIATNVSNIATNTADIVSLDSRVTTLETSVDDALSIITTTPLATQTLVANVAEKLNWMTTAIVDTGNRIEHTIVSNDILIKEAGVYEVFGTISIYAPVNDIVEIELYIDNLPTGFSTSMIGRGNTSKVSFTNGFLAPFGINDDVHLYVKSTGTEIDLQAASMTIIRHIGV